MDLNSGYPYSLIRSGLPYTYPRLDRDLSTRVAVIGAGISGALTAHALVRAGIECVVLDARTVGLGSTSASTSLLQYEIDVRLTDLIEKIGKSGAQRSYELCAKAIAKLETISKRVHADYFEMKKSLYLASYKKDVALIEAEYKARREMGLDVTLWDEKTIRELTGIQAPAAIYSATGAQTDAYCLTHALHQYNIKKGAQVFDRTLVKDIRHHAKSVELITEHGPRVTARQVVIATGYEALQYLPEKVVDLKSTYAVASGHMPGRPFWYEDCLIWETKDPYLYMRSTSDGRIIAGGRDEPYYNPTRRDALLKKKTKQLQQDVQDKFPGISFFAEFAWTGTFGSTDDGLPYIGTYHKMPHTFFALGFGGNGITFSQIAAEIVTSMILGKKHRDEALFSFDRLKK